MPYQGSEKDYPISRALTSPIGKGVGSVLATSGAMLAIKKALGTKVAREVAAKFGKQLGPASGPTGKQIAGTAAISGGLSGIFANVERDIYAKALESKMKSGRGGFTSQEKKLLVGPREGTGKLKGFSEYYITPKTHALGRAAMGLLFGGPAGAITEGLTGGTGTAVSRHLWARALVARSRRGSKLTKGEESLLRTIQRSKR
jgi:hypothetical protein